MPFGFSLKIIPRYIKCFENWDALDTLRSILYTKKNKALLLICHIDIFLDDLMSL